MWLPLGSACAAGRGAPWRHPQLGGLSGKEDHGLVTVGEDELYRELVKLGRDGGEDRLELGKPATECLASSIPVLFGMECGIGGLVGLDGVVQGEALRRVRDRR